MSVDVVLLQKHQSFSLVLLPLALVPSTLMTAKVGNDSKRRVCHRVTCHGVLGFPPVYHLDIRNTMLNLQW